MGKKKAHVLAVPFPAQGHVTPLLKLSRLIASHGVRVTFVNTQFIHDKIARASHDHLPVGGGDDGNLIMTAISDGLAGDDHRRDASGLMKSLKNTMAGNLTELIEEINGSDGDEKISCIVADFTLGWILEIAQDFGAQAVAFLPTSVATFALTLHLPTLIQQGDLDSNGTLRGSEVVSLSDDIPPWKEDDLGWNFPTNSKIQKMIFESSLSVEKSAKFVSKWLLCNSFYELESSACDMNPKFLPIGPLLNTSSSNYSSSFYSEDSSCLSWLDGKPAASVVYVSFGSVAEWSPRQLDELALGLELSGRAFLWVVRSNLTSDGSPVEYPCGFLDRVCSGGGVGKIVEWAPQEKVLSHPSVGCFLSHCGWNSTLEGLGAGVPFLCWPYFADQYHNRNYICDKWKIGLRIEQDGDGIRGRDEIKRKIEMLLVDDEVKANALRLKEMAARSVAQDGSSFLNLQKFIHHLME